MAGSLVFLCCVLFFVGCNPRVTLEVTGCDPRYRSDCWAITKEDLQWLLDKVDELEDVQAKLDECPKRL